jgi:AraC-like DNA-binding protein
MLKPNVVKSRGILNPKVAETKFQISRHSPSPDLNFFVERYWIIHWDLRGQAPYVQETLPYPCVNLVFETGATRIFGVITGKFARLLEDQGGVFGIKFKPGGFYPFVKWPLSKLTNDSMSLEDAFGIDSHALEAAILSADNEGKMIELAEHFLRQRLPERDENFALINEIVDYIITHREVRRVDDVVNCLHLSKRTLQRLFSLYVGVSPKWVIKRYRLHEAAEQLDRGGVVDWPRLALELGYFDQAHFIKDFKSIVGKTPMEYARQAALNSQGV